MYEILNWMIVIHEQIKTININLSNENYLLKHLSVHSFILLECS